MQIKAFTPVIVTVIKWKTKAQLFKKLLRRKLKVRGITWYCSIMEIWVTLIFSAFNFFYKFPVFHRDQKESPAPWLVRSRSSINKTCWIVCFGLSWPFPCRPDRSPLYFCAEKVKCYYLCLSCRNSQIGRSSFLYTVKGFKLHADFSPCGQNLFLFSQIYLERMLLHRCCLNYYS